MPQSERFVATDRATGTPKPWTDSRSSPQNSRGADESSLVFASVLVLVGVFCLLFENASSGSLFLAVGVVCRCACLRRSST